MKDREAWNFVVIKLQRIGHNEATEQQKYTESNSGLFLVYYAIHKTSSSQFSFRVAYRMKLILNQNYKMLCVCVSRSVVFDSLQPH